MPGNHPIVQNSHRLFSQITHSLMNTACPLLMLSPMIKNVWIAAEIEENVFVQYKNLPFLKPAETQAKRITKLVSHPTWLGLFPLPNSQKPITTQTWGYFTSQPRHDFVSPIPLTHTEQNLVLHSWNAPESPSQSFSEPGQGTGTAENKPVFPLAVFRWHAHCAAL